MSLQRSRFESRLLPFEGRIGTRVDGQHRFALPVVVGFEDVLPRWPDGGERAVGEGTIYNTPASIGQLLFAICVAPNPAVAEIMNDQRLTNPRAVVERLRNRQVLQGMKMLDLGCGLVPGVALAAKALGAEMYTADGQALDSVIAQNLDGHTVVDFTTTEATSVLAQATGGDLDLVVENIIGSVESCKLPLPDRAQTKAIGEVLLKPGGYFHLSNAVIYQKLD